MKFHYMGKFDGNNDALPTREHEEGYVPFKEPSAKKLMVVINVIAFVITVPLIIWVAAVDTLRGSIHIISLWFALAAFFASIFPHEVLHALCFKSDVYMYTYLSKGACFVVGPELMSKPRFVFMCLLPNIVFGLIPFIIWLIFPGLTFFGYFGALAIGAGGGDYMNVVNCLIQVPRGAKTYMHGMNSFWVKTEKEI